MQKKLIKISFCAILILLLFSLINFSQNNFIAEMNEDVITESNSSKVTVQFINRYQELKLNLIANGSFLDHPNGPLFCVWVTNDKMVNLDEGRKLALHLTKNYVKEIQTNPNTVKYYECACQSIPSRYFGKIDLKDVGIKIAFWDENIERPKMPLIAEITFLDGKFRYYEADAETQALKLIYEESYENAIESYQKK
jgi:hypothetical protein